MRISEKEKDAIINEARNQFGAGSSVILFGSRANDKAKGGDIDLLIIPGNINLNELFSRKINFLVNLKNTIDDQKIDVIVKRPDENRGIHKKALKEGITLY
jgi:predicted nucleotidyltransferase